MATADPKVYKDLTGRLKSTKQVFSLKKRNLQQLQEAYRESVRQNGVKGSAILDTEIKELTQELESLVSEVEHLEREVALNTPNVPFETAIPTPTVHKFTQKIFLPGTVCEACRKLIIKGFRCESCNYRTHGKCLSLVPSTCGAEAEQYYKRMLAQSCPTTPGLTPPVIRINRSGSPTPNANVPPAVSPVSLRKQIADASFSSGSPSIPPAALVRSPSPPTEQERLSALDTPDGVSLKSHVSGISNASKHSQASAKSAQLGTVAQHSPNSIARPVGLKPLKLLMTTRGSDGISDSLSDPGSDDDDGRRANGGKEWEIPYSDLVLEKRIGAGACGTVYKGKWHGDVAIKVLKVQNASESSLEDFRNEISVLRKTRHKNIVLFMGACTDIPHLCIVTKWCEGNTLYKLLHAMDGEYTLSQVTSIAQEIAQGMEYLHAKNIIHRDLKSSNVFLDNDYQVNIGDFGLSTVKQICDENTSDPPERRVRSPMGSVLWMAPEVIRMEGDPYTPAADVYAFGIVLFELLARELPYAGFGPDQIMFMVGSGAWAPKFEKAREDAPPQLIELMKSCVARNPTERNNFGFILKRIEKIMSMKGVLEPKRTYSSPALALPKSLLM